MWFGKELFAIKYPVECSTRQLLLVQNRFQLMNELIQVAGCARKYGRKAGNCREVGSQMGQMELGVLL